MNNFNRGDRVYRKDNKQCGVVYKEPKGGILYVIPTCKVHGKANYDSRGSITTWHESMVYKTDDSFNKPWKR